MPTGYTATLYYGEDTTFSDFAMHCARAFGALIEMREEPMNAAIPDKFEASSYHMEQLEEAEADIARIKAWDDAEAERQAQLAHDREQREYEELLAHKAAIRERYEAMLAQVKVWTPPTPEHRGLKEFMTEQLEESIDCDCCTKHLTTPEPLTGTAYKEQQLSSS